MKGRRKLLNLTKQLSVADPGFPAGGASTPKAVTFRKFCMLKRKDLDPYGGVRRARPLDPPMVVFEEDSHQTLSKLSETLKMYDELSENVYNLKSDLERKYMHEIIINLLYGLQFTFVLYIFTLQVDVPHMGKLQKTMQMNQISSEF